MVSECTVAKQVEEMRCVISDFVRCGTAAEWHIGFL